MAEADSQITQPKAMMLRVSAAFYRRFKALDAASVPAPERPLLAATTPGAQAPFAQIV
jgi:hypothetical protein